MRLISGVDYRRVVGSGKVVVLLKCHFCVNCGRVEMLLRELEGSSGGDIDYCMLFLDENIEIANEYGLRSVPVMQLWGGGKLISTVSDLSVLHSSVRLCEEIGVLQKV